MILLSRSELQQEYVIAFLKLLQVQNEINIVAFALLAYDYLLTLELEVDLIWNAPWGVIKILYILTRFIPFTMIISILRTTVGVPDTKCKMLIEVETWFMIIGMVTAEAIFTTRTWAVCGNKKWLGGVLLVLYIGIGVSAFVVIAQFLDSMTITLQHSIFPSCLITNFSKSSFFTIDWGLLFVFDVVNLGLLIAPAYYSFRQRPSNLIRLVLREGLTYYIYISVVASAIIVVGKSTASDYSSLLAEPGRVFHSIFACRVVLHTREEARKTQIATDTWMLNLETEDQLLFAPPALLNSPSSHLEV